MKTAIKLYSWKYADFRTYLFALLFVAGNILLPQLCHLIPTGGLTLLPIYFFTLIAAYKFGFRVGLLTAILSPVINHLLFGMPSVTVLPVILTKSVLLAASAYLVAQYTKNISILAILVTVFAYQFVGTLAEWMFTGSVYIALQNLRMGIPGILIQIFGGYVLLKAIAKK